MNTKGYTVKDTSPHLSSCLQVLNQLAQDFEEGKTDVAVPIMYNDEIAYIMETS